jgi:hypothetical protein
MLSSRRAGSEAAGKHVLTLGRVLGRESFLVPTRRCSDEIPISSQSLCKTLFIPGRSSSFRNFIWTPGGHIVGFYNKARTYRGGPEHVDIPALFRWPAPPRIDSIARLASGGIGMKGTQHLTRSVSQRRRRSLLFWYAAARWMAVPPSAAPAALAPTNTSRTKRT